MCANFKRYWHSRLFDDSKSNYGNIKLRNYRLYKHHFRKEEYLTEISHRPYRSSFAKLRLSAHKLKIETGRYVKKEDKVPPSERICNFCKLQECEDEYHLMMRCELYKNERDILMQRVTSLFPHIHSYRDVVLYEWLMANLNGDILLSIGKFIHSCFEKRSISTSALSVSLHEN